MIKLAEAAERIATTTKKLEKTAIVAEYLKSSPPEDAALSAVFLSGRPFPVWEETTLQVGGSLLWRIVAEISGKSEAELTAAYRQLGDLGAVAGNVLPASSTPGHVGLPASSTPGHVGLPASSTPSHVGTGAPARPGRAKPGSSSLTIPAVVAAFRQIASARGPA